MLSGCEINSRILFKRETAKVRNSSSVVLNDLGSGRSNLFVIACSSLSRSPIAVMKLCDGCPSAMAFWIGRPKQERTTRRDRVVTRLFGADCESPSFSEIPGLTVMQL
jgi:hypothetical protein